VTRFTRKSNHIAMRSVLVALLLFVLVASLFLYGLHSVSDGSIARQKTNLLQALNRTATYCYAVEGAYPESLSYMKEHYGLTYDEDLFYVDYVVRGSNLFPDITVIEIGG